jgi:prepilin-type N-terminal cleavage/methylation domain-containing protein
VAGSRTSSACGRKGTSRLGAGGFTLLEVTLAMTVLLVAMMAASASTLRMHTLRRVNRERVVAQNGVRSVSERLQSLSTRGLVDPAGWSTTVLRGVAAGGEVGPTFDLRELQPRAGAASLGTVEVVTDETKTDLELGAQLGMPRDLDGDGTATSTDVSTTALLLPVVVRARWHGAGGDGRVQHGFFLAKL